MFSVIRRILSYAKSCRKEVVGMLFFALIGTGLSLFVPVLIGKAVDCVARTHKVDSPPSERLPSFWRQPLPSAPCSSG